MCDVCQEAAEAVAATTDGALDAEDVRRIVRAFQEESERVMEKQAAEPVGPDVEQDGDAPGFEEFVEALGGRIAEIRMVPLGITPYVLIEAEQLDSPSAEDGRVHIAVSATMGGGITDEAALEVMEKAVEQVKAARG